MTDALLVVVTTESAVYEMAAISLNNSFLASLFATRTNPFVVPYIRVAMVLVRRWARTFHPHPTPTPEARGRPPRCAPSTEHGAPSTFNRDITHWDAEVIALFTSSRGREYFYYGIPVRREWRDALDLARCPS